MAFIHLKAMADGETTQRWPLLLLLLMANESCLDSKECGDTRRELKPGETAATRLACAVGTSDVREV